jgi:hypothetical protein
LPRTRTRVARHTPHTVPELAHAHRVAHFRRHTSFTSCGHAALTTSPPTHSPHTGARPAPVVGAPPLIRLAPSVPHVQLPLSLAHAWPHPQRLTLASQRKGSPALSHPSESLANLVRILRVAQCGSKLRVRDLPVVVLVGVLLGDGEDVLVREGQVEGANTQLKLEERKLAGLVQVKLTERRLEQVVPERERNQRSSAAICHCQRQSAIVSDSQSTRRPSDVCTWS